MSKHVTAPDDTVGSQQPSKPSLVVGLGASAGGIKALAEFFKHVSAGQQIAYVVILHLSPTTTASWPRSSSPPRHFR